MVNQSIQLDRVFGALADPTRRQMVLRLSEGPATVGQLGEPFEMTKGAISKHVKVLENAGLLKRQVDGRLHRCEINASVLGDAQVWISQVRAHWESSFDDLAEYLESLKEMD